MNIGQIYHLASIICYVLSALAAAFTIFLFFRFKIVDAFNVLSGRKLKRDMERLRHLSGSASENEDEVIALEKSGKSKKKKRKKEETEELYGLSGIGSSGNYDTEEAGAVSASDTEALYNTEATEDLSNITDTTDELDIVFTDASDTDLL